MKKKLILALFGAVMLSSCSNGEIESNGTETCECMEVLPVVEGSASRAAKNSWSDGDVIGWYLANSGTTYMGTSYMNKKLSYSTFWELETVPSLSGTEGTLYAYYPWNAGISNFSAIPVESASQTDYMWGKASGFTSSSPSQVLTMKHALTQIAVNIVRGTYAYTGSVSSVVVNSANIGTTGSLDATSGVVTVSGGINTDNTIPGAQRNINSTGQLWSGLFLAKSTPGALTLKITLDGIKYSVTTPSITPTAGQIHTFTITANSTGLSISSVTLKTWENGTGGSGTIQ